MTYEFDRGTALAAGGDGRYTGELNRDFWVVQGPNGGYLAAIALRGATAESKDPARVPRSMHVRYLAVPKAGAFELQAATLRTGRSMTTVGVTMRQDGREFLSASFCFSTPFEGVAFQDCVMPEARAFAEAQPMPPVIPLNGRFDSRLAIGGLLRAGARAETGGYQRFADGRPIDVLALAAMWDAWPPALFFRRCDREATSGVPTVEATVYFRRPIPFEGFDPSDYVVLRMQSTLAHDGFVEEDGEIWSRGGHLLVQSRQLALCR